MEQNYDFSKIGKQMPYTVPDNFFDELEENVMKEVKVQPAKKKATVIRMAIRTALAVAACLALFLIVKKNLPQGSDTSTDDFENVELAFNNLSTEDQAYLLEVYQEEQFMDNEFNDFNDDESI
jgi:hypothetical protein